MSGCGNAGQALHRGLRLYSERTALPFLYQTPTIRRYYSELHSDDVSTGPRITKVPVESSTSPRTTKFPVDSSRSSPTHKKTYQGSERPRKFVYRPDPDLQEPKSNEDFVPFEDSASTSGPESVIPSPAERTTISGTERRVFEKLESLAGSSSRSDKGFQAGAYDNLDAVLNEAISNIQFASRQAQFELPTRKPARRTNPDHTPLNQRSSGNTSSSKKGKDQDSSLESIEDADELQPPLVRPRKVAIKHRLDDSDAILKKLHSAKTDLELWAVLENELFQPLASLNLDNTTSDPSNASKGRAMMRSFPGNLAAAASILRTSFPTSNLILSLLPTLRTLGPSAFTLGATPRLYNQIIAFLFEKHSDLDGINTLFAEMEREVIEPNITTLKLLDYMINVRQRVIRGNYSIAIRAVWGTERFRRAWDVLGRWKGQVESVLMEQEIRSQKKKAVEQEDKEGEEGEQTAAKVE